MRAWAMLAILLMLAACGGSQNYSKSPAPKQGSYKVGKPYKIDGQWYYPEFDASYDERGVASWYGEAFHGRPTANGEVFDRHIISAAHTTLPLPSLVEVTNLENGQKMIIRVNDRGPFVDNRIIDLSEAAAKKLGFHSQGLARVRVKFLRIAEGAKGDVPRPVAQKRAPSPKSKVIVAATKSTSCRTDQHFVQVAAIGDTHRANLLADQLRAVGPVWMESTQPTHGQLHRVRIGPLSDRRMAFDILSQLRRLGYQEAYVADCTSAHPS